MIFLLQYIRAMRSLLTTLLLIVVFCACGVPRVIFPAAEQNTNVETLLHDGKPYLRSVMEKTEVSAQLVSIDGSSLALDLFFYNNTDEQFLIDPSNVQVTGFNAFGIPRTFRIFSAAEYIRRRNTNNAIVGGLLLVATVASVVTMVDAGVPTDQVLLFGAGAVPSLVNDFGLMTPISNEDGLARPHNLFPETAYRGRVMLRGYEEYFHKVQVNVPANGIMHRFDFLPLLKG